MSNKEYLANPMITIGTLKVDLQAGREPFVRDLYGRWEDFNRTSLEKVVDEVLSCYDTEDELIRVGVLDLDLGEIEKADFYERFPRKLAERLDDIFTSYLRNKEEHPDKIAVLPIKQSWLDIFEHYMLRGYWPLMEGEWQTLPGLVDKLLPVTPEGVNRFLRVNYMVYVNDFSRLFPVQSINQVAPARHYPLFIKELILYRP